MRCSDTFRETPTLFVRSDKTAELSVLTGDGTVSRGWHDVALTWHVLIEIVIAQGMSQPWACRRACVPSRWTFDVPLHPTVSLGVGGGFYPTRLTPPDEHSLSFVDWWIRVLDS